MQSSSKPISWPYLHSAAFDAFFICATVGLALALGFLASASSAMLLAVVSVNIWLFANPHLIATFARMNANRNAHQKHWFLIFIVPFLVLLALTIIALAYEVSGLFTLYLFAQTFHVTRQSYGIARTYRRIAEPPLRRDVLSELLIYIFPLWGLLHWCSQGATSFLYYPVSLPAVPSPVVNLVGGLALNLAAVWVIRQCRPLAASSAISAISSSQSHDWFVASHICIFAVAYLGLSDMTLGWLIVNIWHNVQYLLFVWWKNSKNMNALPTDSQGSTSASPALLWKRGLQYLGLCALCGAVLYELFDWIGHQFLWLGLPTVLILHFTLNFHHYWADAVIWKRSKLPAQMV
jgi:hypothetical protein